MVLPLLGIVAAVNAPLPPLHVQGYRLVDPQGREVLLKGANLGNWHVIEFWMLALKDTAGKPKDQYDLEALLTRRFGEREKDRLMDVYRASWITERDFRILPTFGFNVVRLPTNYRLMEDDRRPFVLKKDAWKWIDRAVDLAERNGLYTIIDMHGAQGGQSPYDHTGRAGQNHLKDSAEDQRRLAWLWGEIAKRYRHRSAVVAYDVFNEPYGTPKPLQKAIFAQSLASIRKVDPDKLVYAMGNYDDFAHYGDPKANGWRNVGFQMHYYPGLFGGGDPTVATQRRHLDSLNGVAELIRRLDVPFLVGEMNVVFDAAGGTDMMRRTYDRHAGYGWGTTMWSYKVQNAGGGHGRSSWGAVANARPAPQVDFAKDSKAAIEAYFRSFATQELSINRPLQKALGDASYRPAPLPPAPPKRTVAPQESLPGWTQADVGGALKGGLSQRPEGGVALFGGGRDIWGESDQFRFLYRRIEGDFVLETTIEGIEDIDSYTKAGLMIRTSTEPDAPFAMISSFPSGELQFGHRDASGASVVAPPTAKGPLKHLRVRLERRNGAITASFSRNGTWSVLGTIPDRMPRAVLVGAAACSHSPDELARIDFGEIDLKTP